MKSLGLLPAASGCSGPLQELKKANAKREKSTDSSGGNRGAKRDRVKEYMEQQFYGQFLPTRDFNSRIRKLALDKDTLRRAQGNTKKQILKTAAANSLTSINGMQTTKQKTTPKQKKKKTKNTTKKRGPHPKTKEEICSMVQFSSLFISYRFCLSLLLYY